MDFFCPAHVRLNTCLWKVIQSASFVLFWFFLATSVSFAAPAVAFQTEASRADEIGNLAKEAAKAGEDGGEATIFLLVLTEDGVPPKKLNANIDTLYGPKRNHSISTFKRLDARQAGFQLKVKPGSVSLVVFAEGFAPATVLANEEITAGSEVEVEVSLDVGLAREILVVDENKNPIESASISTSIRTSKNSTTGYGSRIRTDSDGMASLDHLPEEGGILKISKAGYDSDKLEGLPVNAPIVVTLKENPTTSGTVLKHDGAALSSATIWDLSDSMVRNFENRKEEKPTAITNERGVFEFKTLSKGIRRPLLIESAESRAVLSVEGGQQANVKMPATHRLKFQLKGDPAYLDRELISVQQTIVIDNWVRKFTIPFESSKDKKNEFLAEGLLAEGKVTVNHSSLGQIYQSSELKPGTNKVAIDLAQFTVNNQRTIELTFLDENETVAPRGTIRVREQDSDGGSWDSGQLVKVDNGKAKVKIESDSIRVSDEGLIGYGILEKLGSVVLKADADVIKVPVKAAGAIQGLVKNAKGEPVSTKIRTSFKFVDRQKRLFIQPIEVISNQKGKFLVTPVPLGVVAEVQVGDFHVKDVDVNLSTPIAVADIVLPDLGSATVVVKDVSGNSMPNTIVNLEYTEGNGTHSRGTRTNKNGEVVFDKMRESGINYFANIGPPAGFQLPEKQAIKVGDQLEFVVKPGHRLKGRVIDQDGSPVEKCIVRAHFGDKTIDADQFTNRNGEFEFTRLPHKPVKLQARHRWLNQKTGMSKELTPGVSDPVTLRLSK